MENPHGSAADEDQNMGSEHDSACTVCGRVVKFGWGGCHLAGPVLLVFDFETFDDIPRVINLKMFDADAPDIEAHIVHRTLSSGLQKCGAEFVIRK